MKNIATNLAIITSALFIALLISEGIVRVFVKKDIIEHDILETVHRPGGEWDKHGFRNLTTTPELARTIAIGDSQTYGHNATQANTWPQYYGTLTDQSVYQMALGGYGFANYWYLFEEALQYEPENIIVGFYFGNDTSDTQRVVYKLDYWGDYRSPNFTIEEQEKTFADVQTIARFGEEQSTLKKIALSFRLWIRRHSKLYDFLAVSTTGLRQKLGFMKTQEDIDRRIAEFTQFDMRSAYVFPEERFQTILSPSYRIGSLSIDKSVGEEGWRLIRQFLLKMQAETITNDIEFAVVLIPTKEAVYGQYASGTTSALPNVFTNILAAEENILTEVTYFCQQQSITCINARDEMVADMQAGTMLYTPSLDGHPTDSGYQAIARAVAKELSQDN